MCEVPGLVSCARFSVKQHEMITTRFDLKQAIDEAAASALPAPELVSADLAITSTARFTATAVYYRGSVAIA